MASTTNNGWATPDDTSLVKDGASAIRTLGSAIDTSVGTGLLAWTAYTPSISNFTLGNGTISFAYAKLGKIVFLRGLVTLGTTSSMGSNPSVTLPVTSFSSSGSPTIGEAQYNDTGVGTYMGNFVMTTTNSGQLLVTNTTGTYAIRNALTATIPMTWTSTDSFAIYATYQAA